ncbi:MAG: RIP metalloprotease RseP [Bacilli bacterium]|nr:RIP metalloprotease RseP [Bacilli bacterium]
MSLIYFVLILGVTVFVHELGHFLFAKRAGIYVYEFAIGMGPKLYSYKRKNDETVYSIRLIPLGGFVQMAGEEINENKDVPEDRRMQSKTWFQRFSTIIAGCFFNFILAFILLFVIGLFYGAPELKPYLKDTLDNYPAQEAGMEKGDLILSVNGQYVSTYDDVMMKFEIVPKGSTLTFEVRKDNGDIEFYQVAPKKEVVDKETTYKFGIVFTDKVNYGLGEAVKFTVVKFASIFKTMYSVVGNLITGKLGTENLAGPVGIYSMVAEEAAAGIKNIIYLIAFLSINIGFINLLPFPAFDGGRLLILLIEKIKGSQVNPKIENIIHAIGFAILLLLMILITIQDISRL